jgi:hypothetical protein
MLAMRKRSSLNRLFLMRMPVMGAATAVSAVPRMELLPVIQQALEGGVLGDRRHFISAIIVANPGNLRRWAGHQGLAFTSDADLAAKPEAIASMSSSPITNRSGRPSCGARG